MQNFKAIVSIIIFFATAQANYAQFSGYFSKNERVAIEQIHINDVSYHSAFATDLVEADTTSKSLKLIPLINSNVGFSTEKNIVYCFTPGLYTFFPLGKKVSLWIAAAVNYEKYPAWLFSKIDSNQILPEGGKARTIANGSYYKPLFVGELSLAPLKYCNLDAGFGKKHWGDGYRSLWLSDYSAYYPYVQLRVNFWKIQYHILWAYLKDINTQASAGKFLDKYGVFHFFDFNATRRLSVGFFESIIWWGQDPATHRGIDPAYLNPVIFFRPVEYSLHSPDNANLGLHASLRLWKTTRFYHQLFIDDLSVKKILEQPQWWGNKYGILAGVKTYQLLGITNLFSQWEYIRVRPYSYSHSSSALNYGTFYQPLGHPLGANFEEYLFVVRYSKNRWSFYTKVSVAVQGRDSLSAMNVGQNIYKSYLYRQTVNDQAMFLQGERHRLLFVDLRLYRSLSKHVPMDGFIGIQCSKDRGTLNSITETVLRIGITANFFNDERDY